MRSGTEYAIFFGYLLRLLRTRASNPQTMRQLAEKLGMPGYSAAVSQIEKGQRALKEPKIALWESALDLNEGDLKELWWLSQGMVLNSDQKRIFYFDYIDLRNRILDIMYCYHIDEMIQVPKLEEPTPIKRPRDKSSTTDELAEIIKLLSAPERDRVYGYIRALIENR